MEHLTIQSYFVMNISNGRVSKCRFANNPTPLCQKRVAFGGINRGLTVQLATIDVNTKGTKQTLGKDNCVDNKGYKPHLEFELGKELNYHYYFVYNNVLQRNVYLRVFQNF